jgi:DNA-binding HxlR family transcriptional regulator
MKTEKKQLTKNCLASIAGVRDVQDLLSGKWKFAIIAGLNYEGKMRFMDLVRHIDGIAPKVLSKELKDLELNHLVTRTVCDTQPITVEYELTKLGYQLETVISEMGKWGILYRKIVFSKDYNNKN